MIGEVIVLLVEKIFQQEVIFEIEIRHVRWISYPSRAKITTAYNAERLMTAQMMALLENVWFALDLQTYLTHPVNEGWKQVFEHWTNNPIIREHWNERIHEEFSPVFRGFVKSIQNAE